MFVTVILIFLYKYQSSVFEKQHEDIRALERVADRLKEEKDALQVDFAEASYFR